MAKMYRKKDGIIVISGPVKDVRPSSNGMGFEVTFEIQEYNKEEKVFITKEFKAFAQNVDSSVSVGNIAVAYGYQCRPDAITTDSVMAGPFVKTISEKSEIVSGYVKKAYLNNEKNEDGSPKLKADGVTPRKPHFDILVPVTQDGRNVLHRISIYNFANPFDGGKSEIDKAAARFKDFVDEKTTPLYVTFVTTPAEIRPWEKEYNGRVYMNYSALHFGKSSWDLNYVDAPVQNSVTETTPVHAPIPEPVPYPYQSQPYRITPPEDEGVFN